MEKKEPLHFLVLTFPFQGHINPALHFVKRLALTTSSRVTFSTTINAHRLMFPSLSENATDLETKDEHISYIPFSDGYDTGLPKDITQFNQYMSDFNRIGSRSVSAIVETLANQGREVSCIIYTLLLPWAADVARKHHIPSALYWIQPASVFAIYYHFFHGYGGLVKSKIHDPSFEVEFPGLQPHKIQDLPSFITMSIDKSDILHCMYVSFRDLFVSLDREKTKQSNPLVIINTFAELEARELSSLTELDMLPIGPLLPLNGETSTNNGDLFKQDEQDYIQWLDTKAEKSVVYVSFGSLSHLNKNQQEELLNAFESSNRPYLWVVRKDNRVEGVEFETVKHGMVVQWCDQVRVLSHPSIGCFVTHCGWNSTLESLSCGVLMVCVPRMSDQNMNASLIESVWGVGLRAKTSKGALEGKEMIRCIDLIMDGSEKSVEMRTRAEVWKKMAREVMSEGGPSERNLRALVERVEEMLVLF